LLYSFHHFKGGRGRERERKNGPSYTLPKEGRVGGDSSLVFYVVQSVVGPSRKRRGKKGRREKRKKKEVRGEESSPFSFIQLASRRGSRLGRGREKKKRERKKKGREEQIHFSFEQLGKEKKKRRRRKSYVPLSDVWEGREKKEKKWKAFRTDGPDPLSRRVERREKGERSFFPLTGEKEERKREGGGETSDP